MEKLIGTLLQTYGKNGAAVSEKMTLNWQMVKELAADPLVTIGAHTINHYRLNTLSPEALQHEMAGSAQLIQKQIGKPVTHFSYPFGTRNDVGTREFEMAKACGFTTAVTTRSANLFPEHAQNLHALPRINVDMNVGEKELLEIMNGTAHFVAHRGKRVITL